MNESLSADRKKPSVVEAIEQNGVQDIETLMQTISKDVDVISDDFVKFDNDLNARMNEMFESSLQHMEWLRDNAQATSIIAQKTSDYCQIFKQESLKMNEKCKQLNTFEKFLKQIDTKLKSLENIADKVMGPDPMETKK